MILCYLERIIQPVLKQRGKRWFPFLILSFVCLLGYANSLQNGFLLDDDIVLFGEKGVSNTSFAGLFSHYQWAFFRPVGHIILWLSSRLFGDGVLGYHLVSLAMFIAIVFLFFRIAMELSHNKTLAWLASLLYALHPVHSMLVDYVTATVIGTFVLCLEISLLTLIAFLNDPRQTSLRPASLLFFTMALLSHEMALAFPLMIFSLFHFLFRQRVKETVRIVWPYFGIAGAFFVLRLFFFSLRPSVLGVQGILHVPAAYLASLWDLFSWYVSKLLVPLDILFLWTGRVPETGVALKAGLLVAVLVGVLWLMFVYWKKGLAPFALSMFVLGLLPAGFAAFTYFPASGPIIEPHWFYFSDFGFFLLVAQAFVCIRPRLRPALWTALIGVVLGGYFILLVGTNTRWRNQETYCRYWISLNQGNMTPFYGLGRAFNARGEYDLAVRSFERGMESVHYLNAFILTELGYAQFQKGDRPKAVQCWQAALGIDPGYSVIYDYLGRMYVQDKNWSAARQAYEQAVRLYPRHRPYRQKLEEIEKRLTYEREEP